MPIYEYRCASCGHRTDILHGINEQGPNFCPACGAEGTMRKTISAPSVHFKGSGWAKRDRASATKTKAAAKGEASPKSSGDGDAKSDGAATPPSTPAAKPVAPASSDGD